MQFRWENSWILVIVAIFECLFGCGVTTLVIRNAYELSWSSADVLYLLYSIYIGVFSCLFLCAAVKLTQPPQDYNGRIKHLFCGLSLILWPILCILLCYHAYTYLIPIEDDDQTEGFFESFALLCVRLFFISLEGLVYHLQLRKHLWIVRIEPIQTSEEA